MPFSAGVVQEAGVPLRPAISTRQRRHDPNGSRLSVAQSLGTWMPAREAARIREVPTGTVTGKPSISSVTDWVAVPSGVPRSIGLEIDGFPVTVPVKIFGKVLDCAHHRHGRQPAERAQRTVA